MRIDLVSEASLLFLDIDIACKIIDEEKNWSQCVCLGRPVVIRSTILTRTYPFGEQVDGPTPLMQPAADVVAIGLWSSLCFGEGENASLDWNLVILGVGGIYVWPFWSPV